MSEQDKSKEFIRKLAKEWPTEDTNLLDVMITGIESAIPTESEHESAKEAREFAKKAREFGFTEKGVMFLVKAESARKDFLYFDCVVKGEKFTHPSKRGFDRLSNELFEILKQLGSEVSSKAVLKVLRTIADADSPNAVIQKVNDEAVFWRDKKSNVKSTSFRSFENRLTKLREKI